jgi:D-glycero-D-manno-heptose 1,7-bisphosphate phosphatase
MQMKGGDKRNKAVFLDRDGVINFEMGDYVYEPENFRLNDGLYEALEKFRDRGYILIVITNQAGIALQRYTHAHVEKLHDILKESLSARGIEIADIYYCPHHPSEGKCLCRKPESLMIEKAIARFNIDPSRSIMIGDREKDMEAASGAGVRGFRITPNESLMNYLDVILPAN